MRNLLNIGAPDPEGLSDEAKFRVLRNILQQTLEAQTEAHSILKQIVERDAARLDSVLKEGQLGILSANGTTGIGSYTFDAQTHDVEIVKTIIVVSPGTVTDLQIEFDGGESIVPLTAGLTFYNDLELPVINVKRKITWKTAQNTDTIQALILASPAPANMGGVLH